MTINKIKQDLQKLTNPQKTKILQRFFKTGKGEYGQGDIFLGITMPEQRKIAKKYVDASLTEIQKLLHSKIHEHRMVALLILVGKYEKAKKSRLESDNDHCRFQGAIFDFYLKNTRFINNWDLVDISAPNIVGGYLLRHVETKQCLKATKRFVAFKHCFVSTRDNPRKIIYQLARSKNLWERRIAIIATFVFIKHNQFDDTLKISKILLKDPHDLIHKAAGWMLREVGKRNQEVEEKFLKRYYKNMPRTMLRYAIERFDDKKRKFYMGK